MHYYQFIINEIMAGPKIFHIYIYIYFFLGGGGGVSKILSKSH